RESPEGQNAMQAVLAHFLKPLMMTLQGRMRMDLASKRAAKRDRPRPTALAPPTGGGIGLKPG
ncbi:MAG: hypothetical protein AAF658_22395, partial [Myxococcota bacterium]